MIVEPRFEYMTHFLYREPEKGNPYQIALAYLPFLIPADSTVRLIGLSRETGLWETIGEFFAYDVSYELYGSVLPISREWETAGKQPTPFKVVAEVVPLEEKAERHIKEVMESFEEEGGKGGYSATCESPEPGVEAGSQPGQE